MSGTGRLLLAGTLAFGVGLAAALPAERLRASLLETYPGLELGPLTGVAYHGRAVPAAAGGLPLDHLAWTWRPLPLLLGRLAVDVELASGPSHAAFTSASRPWSDGTTLERIEARVDLEMLGTAFPRLPGRLRGRADIADVALELDAAGWPVAATGRIALRAAEVTAPVRLAVGALDAQLAGDGDRLRIDFATADDNPLDADGSLLLDRDGGYRLTASLAARDAADSATTGLLRLAGRPGADGRVSVDRSGRWR